MKKSVKETTKSKLTPKVVQKGKVARMKKVVKKQVSKKVGQMSKELGQDKIILKYIYEHPINSLPLRNLAKKLNLSKSSLHYQLKSFQKEGIIDHKYNFINTPLNVRKKIHFYVELILQSGLIGFLEEQLSPSVIILFGSVQKGELTAQSDIDLFVESAFKKDINVTTFEQFLGHPIQLIESPKITQLPPHLFNNIVNGIKLQGYFTIK